MGLKEKFSKDFCNFLFAYLITISIPVFIREQINFLKPSE